MGVALAFLLEGGHHVSEFERIACADRLVAVAIRPLGKGDSRFALTLSRQDVRHSVRFIDGVFDAGNPDRRFGEFLHSLRGKVGGRESHEPKCGDDDRGGINETFRDLEAEWFQSLLELDPPATDVAVSMIGGHEHSQPAMRAEDQFTQI